MISSALYAQDSLSFRSLQDVFDYANAHSYTFKNASQQNILAKYQTLATKLSQWNLKGDANFSLTDNTKLQTNFLPAEIFGGQPGTFKSIRFGQQYVSNINIAPQIDLLSPYAIAKVKVSKANEQLTEVANLLNKKDLYESVAAAYYNILSYQWQIDITQKSLVNQDSLVFFVQQRHKEGIVRDQDVSDMVSNHLATEDKLQQLQVQLEQQYNSLKLLCDIDAGTPISIPHTDAPVANPDLSLNAGGRLLTRQGKVQQDYQAALLKADKKWFFPTITGFGSLGWQQNSNTRFFDKSTWYGTNYVGLRVSVPILPDANKIAAVKYDRINNQIAANNYEHAVLQDSINNRQLVLDYQKAFKSYDFASRIAILKEDTYYKNVGIYKEGILSATDLLINFNDWLNSGLNAASQLAGSEYAKAKISIKNTVQ